ncbi:MAG: class I SAM-dependent methyltransferase [Thiohalorhabdus sp.]|uniref:class I SAM-dependent methyltransferase n=1 Tax=Thiohalorhabdus sp. TaxID=3094134 RepID=UPI003980048F
MSTDPCEKPDPRWLDGDFERKWRERFERFADQEEDAAIAGWSRHGLEARLAHFRMRWTPEGNGPLWLDAGCGAGTYTRYLEQRGKRVLALDYSLPTIEKARSRGTGDTLWALGDAGRLPLADDSLDGALCFGVTQALSASDALVTELARVVRGGGEVWLDGLNGGSAFDLWARGARKVRGEPAEVRFESPRRLARLLRRRGVRNLQLYWVPVMPEGWSRLQRLFNRPWAARALDHAPGAGRLLCHAFVLKGEAPHAQ